LNLLTDMGLEKSEREIESNFKAALMQEIEENDNFDNVEAGKNYNNSDGERREVDILVESRLSASFVIEMKNDQEYLLDREWIAQAAEYSRDLGTEFFVIANSQILYLFDYRNKDIYSYNQIDRYSADISSMTWEKVADELLESVDSLYHNESNLNTEFRTEIISLMRDYFTSVWPSYKKAINNKYRASETFRKKFDKWIKSNNYGDLEKEEQFEVVSKQYSYILSNRVLFYEVVVNKVQKGEIHQSRDVDGLQSLSYGDMDSLSGNQLTGRMNEWFSQMIDKIDYKPVLKIESDLFSEIPTKQKMGQKLIFYIENIAEIVDKGFNEISEDFVGDIYEELLTREERKALGQFYTKPKIANVICEWVTDIEVDKPNILDPACGSGTFPVEMYSILSRDRNMNHQEILDRLYSVDINKFPTHLTALNLAGQDLSSDTKDFKIYNDSFFDFLQNHPNETFDCIVGNPPYIGEDELYCSGIDENPGHNKHKKHFRNHLESYGPKDIKKWSRSISKNSDAYVYFLTSCIDRLNEGGRLGFIISNKWLMSKYGKGLQKLLLQYCDIKSIIGFNKNVF
jgi:type I restriction-modification system DNA methylase subunit